MSKGSKAPPPPDPSVVAGQQTGSNINTAIAQGALNRVNQVNPYSSTTYNQTGTENVGGYNVPTYTQTTSLDPALTAIKNSTENTAQSLTPTAQTLATQFGTSGITPLNPSGANNDIIRGGPQALYDPVAKAVYNEQAGFLDPQFTQSEKDLQDQLSRQGIPVGSNAYNNAMTNFSNRKNQAYTAAANNATAQGANTAGNMFGLAIQGQNQNLGQQQLLQSNPLQLLSALYSGANLGGSA